MADARPPLWRQAFDAAERRVTPRAEEFVRSDAFSIGAALLRRASTLARGSARGATTRFWHLLDLPAGTDVSRLRAQVGALDREVRRLTLQLETERRRQTEESDAHRPESADDPGPGAPGRRTQRPARP
ncbi:hypothetical protein ACI78V_17650 [Geodermatophilus sp. SYSU D00742]